MLTCPSPQAKLVNMPVRVIAIVFDLCVQYYRMQHLYSNFTSPLKRRAKRGIVDLSVRNVFGVYLASRKIRSRCTDK